MDAAGLRPLRVGEIVDVGIKIYRRRFQTLVRAVAVIVIPVAVVNAVITLSATVSSNGDFGSRDTAALAGASFVTAILGFVAAELAVASCYLIVSGDYVDQSPTWQESVRLAWRRLGSVLWIAFLHLFFASIALIACIVPGVYLYISWAVGIPVLFVEGKRGGDALRRSRDLVKGRWWPVFGTYLLMMLLTSIVNAAVQGVFLAVVAQGNDVASAIARVLATALSSTIVTPLSAAVLTVIYYDLRVRKEGFDLELLARGIGVEPPPDAAARFAVEDLPSDEAPPFWPPPPGWQPGRRPPG